MLTDGAFRQFRGREFQSLGAATSDSWWSRFILFDDRDTTTTTTTTYDSKSIVKCQCINKRSAIVELATQVAQFEFSLLSAG